MQVQRYNRMNGWPDHASEHGVTLVRDVALDLNGPRNTLSSFAPIGLAFLKECEQFDHGIVRHFHQPSPEVSKSQLRQDRQCPNWASPATTREIAG
jgi:hypothetical protein